MNKNLFWAYICLALIAIITLASGSNIGFTVESKPVDSISKTSVFSTTETQFREPIMSPQSEVYTITVSNKFIPRSYPLPEFQGCLYDSKTGKTQYAEIDADVSEPREGFSRFGSVEVGIGKTEQVKYFLVSTPKIPEQEKVDFDHLLLLDQEADCWSILPSELDEAIKIPII